jgi:lipopolysaccharide export system protein LptA
MLAAGFIFFASTYVIYAYFLGGINGLPPLPEDCLLVTDEVPLTVPAPQHENNTKKLLRLAFGEDCPEKDFKFQLESQDKGFVLAMEDFTVLSDGRVELSPFRFVILRKEKDAGKFPEINTIKCNKAFISFDKPVSSIADIPNRKIVGATLGYLTPEGKSADEIYMVNNRRTPERDDDISLFTIGPVHYAEARHLVWTDADVKIKDPQTKPKPMEVTGAGMDIYLTPPPKDGKVAHPPKSKSGTPTGVDGIVLRSSVNMNLFVDARSGFLGSGKNRPGGQEPKPALGSAAKASPTLASQDPRKPAGSVEEKAQLVITAPGAFHYDLRARKALFDCGKKTGPLPNLVKATRINQGGNNDTLTCDHLDLQFQEAAGKTADAANKDDMAGMELESVHATGNEVVLTSDAEILEAHGNDFFFDKRKQTGVLKGEPKMWALKEGNKIEAPQVQFVDQQGAQEVTVLGEGNIQLMDKKTGTRPLEARWKTKLVYGKDANLDLLSLFGEAAFLDHEQGQKLQADILKVWLEPAEPNRPATSDQPKRKPQRIDALGKVVAASPDLNMRDTETLVLYFKDAPPPSPHLPSAAGTSPILSVPQIPGKPADADRDMGFRDGPTGPVLGNPFENQPGDTGKSKRPIFLSARQVTAHIIRNESRNDLERLWCEGSVHVLQEPASPQDKGVDIQGSQLDLSHHVEGNVLKVIGEAGQAAQAQLNKIFIVGPQIDVDQTTNEAWVTGLGLMRMPSKEGLDGAPLPRESELTITWDKSMLFDGQLAKFRGNIYAEQDAGHLFCQEMDVWLDRKISFREGDKGSQPAKVQKLLCEKDVRIEQINRQNEKGQLVSYKRMDCLQISMDNDPETNENIVNASGPGIMRVFSLGGTDDMLPGLTSPSPQQGQERKPKTATPKKGPDNRAGKSKPPDGKDQPAFTLTQMTYDGRLSANNRRGSAIIWDNVQVWHVPTNDPELKINPNKPPLGYMYLRCRKMEVFSHKLPDGRTSKEMRALGKAEVEAKEFSGRADTIKYDESKEQVILEGSEGNPAVLYREKVQGGNKDAIHALKITYWRTTGTFSVDRATGLNGTN